MSNVFEHIKFLRKAIPITWLILAACSGNKNNEPQPQPQPPVITSVSHQLVSAHIPMKVFGSGFGTSLADIKVSINGIPQEVTAVTDVEVSIKIVMRTGTGIIRVTTPLGSADGPQIKYQYTVTVSTLAGNSNGSAINGVGAAATFNFPAGVVLGPSGDLFVGDRNNALIRKVQMDGTVSTYSGSTQGGTNGDISIATFSGPNSIAFDAVGNMFVSEVVGHRIREITTGGIVSTVAGSGSAGFVNANGTGAQFSFPVGIVLDAAANIYVVEFNNHTVRKVTPAGDVTTFAGGTLGHTDATGTAAQFSSPAGIDIDANGNLFVADLGNNVIRKITPAGVVTTFAGSGTWGSNDGTSATAQFAAPRDLVIDQFNNIFVVDGGNNKIRMIEPSGDVSTLAGSGIAFFNDGPGISADFDSPYTIELIFDGQLVVGERNNYRLRLIDYY